MFGSSPLEVMAMHAMIQGDIFCYQFTYSALMFGANALGASGTQTVTTQITADSDFMIQEINLVAYSAVGTVQANPDFTTLITMAGTAYNLMDAPIHVNNLCGNFLDNRVPSHLPFPVLIPANQNLTNQTVNRSAAAQNFVQYAYVGFKIKYLTKATRKDIFHMM